MLRQLAHSQQLTADEVVPGTAILVSAFAGVNASEVLCDYVTCDLSVLRGVRFLIGDLHLFSRSCNATIERVSFAFLEKLEVVNGSVTARGMNASQPTLSFPALRWVTGDLKVMENNLYLESVSFPNLQTIEGSLLVETDPWVRRRAHRQRGSRTIRYTAPALSSMFFPLLSSVGRQLKVIGNTAPFSMSFPQLAGVGSVDIWNNPHLEAVAFPVLKGASSFQVRAKGGLTGISLPVLSSVNASNFEVSSCNNLTSLSLPTLSSVRRNFEAHEKSALTSLSVPSLFLVGRDLWVRDNSALSTLTIPPCEKRQQCGESLSVAGMVSVQAVGDIPAVSSQNALRCLHAGDVSFQHAVNSSEALCADVTDCNLSILRGVRFLFGSLSLTAQCDEGVDFTALSTLATLNGSVILSEVNSAILSFPALRSVTRNLLLGSRHRLIQVERIDFPALREVGGALTVQGHEPWVPRVLSESIHVIPLFSVSLPALSRVGGRFWLNDNANLTLISLPALTSVSEFYIEDNSQLEVVHVPLLKTVGSESNRLKFGPGVEIDSNPQLHRIHFPALEVVQGDFDVMGNGELKSFSADALHSVTLRFWVRDNFALTSITTRSLRNVGFVSITRNSALASLSLIALSTVGGYLRIRRNPVLLTLTIFEGSRLHCETEREYGWSPW
uniref:Receptor L-domain domain-containing protein n=1 Tax=Chromera velia CCMP2878 TaxID=1169474 RepID=A0A0G4HES7_9ALVE|eukprot:Cvel_26866.t1-p1 / transcript=Cvel_26866.t1 / gene=Cvel_26866 / organism=Chromera_velia_CCMP2878 / gene_product=hypothetical protein / transcript_product=hypothetical protein / location=Cvel_scaffold3260:11154-15007(-) / protein_length=669 / sequence_SO=supercontig / SO=protein_coding / is_pseudo=false